MAIPKDLLEILCCPLCRSDLRLEGEKLHCTKPDCALIYAVQDDIPNMLIDEAARPCPKCPATREWDADKVEVRCPKCGATFKGER